MLSMVRRLLRRKQPKKVRQAIRELDYVPNSLAKNMRTHKNKMVGFLVPRLTNSFYARIASAYMEEAQKENYTVSIMDYGYSLEQEKKGALWTSSE